MLVVPLARSRIAGLRKVRQRHRVSRGSSMAGYVWPGDSHVPVSGSDSGICTSVVAWLPGRHRGLQSTMAGRCLVSVHFQGPPPGCEAVCTFCQRSPGALLGSDRRRASTSSISEELEAGPATAVDGNRDFHPRDQPIRPGYRSGTFLRSESHLVRKAGSCGRGSDCSRGSHSFVETKGTALSSLPCYAFLQTTCKTLQRVTFEYWQSRTGSFNKLTFDY